MVGEMTMSKGYVPKIMYVTYTILRYEMCFLRYIRLLTRQYWWASYIFTLMSTLVIRKTIPLSRIFHW